jgi:hypothetical protein
MLFGRRNVKDDLTRKMHGVTPSVLSEREYLRVEIVSHHGFVGRDV